MIFKKQEKINNTLLIPNVSTRINKYLARKGITSLKDAQKYLYPTYNDLYNWEDVDNLKEAVSLTLTHLENGNNILIWGDYDNDGIMASTILYKTLCNFNELSDSEIYVKLPNRIEGYGMNIISLEKIFLKKNIHLLIAVDNGIVSVEEIQYIKNRGIDVIVLDHHTPNTQVLPDADVIVDLHLPNTTYPFKHLAGCGLAYKFACGIYREMGMKEPDEFLQYAAIGTIADCVSLTDENRTIVKLGLELINNNPATGIKALLSAINFNGKVTSEDIAYFIAPCINAPGRLFTPNIAFDLLNTDNFYEAIKIATRIVELNNKRKELIDKFYSLAQIEIDKIKDDKIYILNIPGCPEGIIGILAGKIKEEYNRPVICLTEVHGKLKGSCRSISDFNIYDCLTACAKYIEKYGGHSEAAGLTIDKDDFDKFKKAVLEYADKNIITIPEPVIMIEDEVEIDEIEDIYNELQMLEPFGQDNKKPYYLIKFVSTTNPTTNSHYMIMQNKHIKIFGLKGIDCICFNKAQEFKNLNYPSTFYGVFTVTSNTFNGITKLQLMCSHFTLQNPLDT